MTTRVALLDYTVGNIGSLVAALKRLGAEAYTTRGEELEEADAIILPGVGSLGAAAEMARAALEYVGRKPLLGICLGMQLMFEESEESPGAKGLGIFKGKVVRIRAAKVPHIGWEYTASLGVCPLESGYYYYLHSYGVEASGAPHEGAYIELGGARYVAAVCKDGVYGVQFHPERSGKLGLKVLEGFLREARR